MINNEVIFGLSTDRGMKELYKEDIYSKSRTISTMDEFRSFSSDNDEGFKIEIPWAKWIKRDFCKDVRVKLLKNNFKETI